MIIPNAVGRIDAITEAIRDGDRERAVQLLDAERSRQRNRVEALMNEYGKISRSLTETTMFAVNIEVDDDAWNQARRDCGWKEDA